MNLKLPSWIPSILRPTLRDIVTKNAKLRKSQIAHSFERGEEEFGKNKIIAHTLQLVQQSNRKEKRISTPLKKKVLTLIEKDEVINSVALTPKEKNRFYRVVDLFLQSLRFEKKQNKTNWLRCFRHCAWAIRLGSLLDMSDKEILGTGFLILRTASVGETL